MRKPTILAAILAATFFTTNSLATNSLAQTNDSRFLFVSQNLDATSYYLKVNSEHYDYANKIDGSPIFGGVFKQKNQQTIT